MRDYYGTHTEDPTINLITQYGLRVLALGFELGLVLCHGIWILICTTCPLCGAFMDEAQLEQLATR